MSTPSGTQTQNTTLGFIRSKRGPDRNVSADTLRCSNMFVRGQLDLDGELVVEGEDIVRTVKLLKYDMLRTRYFAIQNRMAEIVRAGAAQTQVIEQLQETSWDTGIVRYQIIATAGTFTVLRARWLRSRNDVEFPHEFSSDNQGTITGGLTIVQDLTTSLPVITLSGSLAMSPSTVGSFISAWFTVSPASTVSWTAPTVFSDSAAPNVALVFQESGLSDTLFFEGIFGAGTSQFIQRYSPGPVAGGGLTSAIEGALDYIPRSAVGTITAAGAFLIERGTLVFGAEIDTIGGGTVDPTLYSLLLNPGATFDDRALVQLPSTVISIGTLTQIETFNNTPHARVGLTNRSYNRPTTTTTAPHLNYCKVTNQTAGRSMFGLSSAPNSAVWFFWNRGQSLWVYGPNDGTPINQYWEGPIGARVYPHAGPPAGEGLDNVFTRWTPAVAAPIDGPLRDPARSSTTGDILDGSERIITIVIGTIRAGTGPSTGFPADVAALPVPAGLATTFSHSLCSMFIGITDPFGRSSGRDSISFASLDGSTSAAWDEDNPYPILVSANRSGAVVYYDVPNSLVESSVFTKNSADLTTVTIPGGLTNSVVNYGTLTVNDVNQTGEFDALFPPAFYLTISSAFSPELQRIQDQIDGLSADLTLFTQPVIDGLIDAVVQLGFADSLISNRIFYLEEATQQTFARLDGLEQAVESLAGSIAALTRQMNTNLGDRLAAAGDINSIEDFGVFLLTQGPELLAFASSSASLGGFGGASTVFGVLSTGLTIARDATIGAQQREAAIRRITRAITLLENGDQAGGVAEGMLGIVLINNLITNANIDVGAGTSSIDADGLVRGQNVAANSTVISDLASRAQQLDPESDERPLRLGVGGDIVLVEAQAQTILNELTLLEVELGLPSFDPDDLDGLVS